MIMDGFVKQFYRRWLYSIKLLALYMRNREESLFYLKLRVFLIFGKLGLKCVYQTLLSILLRLKFHV